MGWERTLDRVPGTAALESLILSREEFVALACPFLVAWVTSTPASGLAPWGRAPPRTCVLVLRGREGCQWAERAHGSLCPGCCSLTCCLHAVKLLAYTLTILAASWIRLCYDRLLDNMGERRAGRPLWAEWITEKNFGSFPLLEQFYLWSEETVQVEWGRASFSFSFSMAFHFSLYLIALYYF